MLRLSKTAKKIIKQEAIRSGLIRTKSFSVNDKRVILTNLNESTILQQIAMDGFESYENELVTFIKNYPWRLSAFIDVGANIGFYSILAELYYPKTTKVVAVEPFPKNIEYIKHIKKVNNLDFELVEKAIDRSSGDKKTLYFAVGKSSSKLASSASLVNSFQGTGGVFNNLPYETVEVATETLSSLMAPYKDSCLIKLDCEGNELPVLESSISVLKRDNVDFIIELMINDSDKHDLFSLMEGYGYKGFLITNAGLIHEDRPLTFPYPEMKNRTIWKNHFFTKRDASKIKSLSENCYGYWI